MLRAAAMSSPSPAFAASPVPSVSSVATPSPAPPSTPVQSRHASSAAAAPSDAAHGAASVRLAHHPHTLTCAPRDTPLTTAVDAEMALFAGSTAASAAAGANARARSVSLPPRGGLEAAATSSYGLCRRAHFFLGRHLSKSFDALLTRVPRAGGSYREYVPSIDAVGPPACRGVTAGAHNAGSRHRQRSLPGRWTPVSGNAGATPPWWPRIERCRICTAWHASFVCSEARANGARGDAGGRWEWPCGNVARSGALRVAAGPGHGRGHRRATGGVVGSHAAGSQRGAV